MEEHNGDAITKKPTYFQLSRFSRSAVKFHRFVQNRKKLIRTSQPQLRPHQQIHASFAQSRFLDQRVGSGDVLLDFAERGGELQGGDAHCDTLAVESRGVYQRGGWAGMVRGVWN